MAKQEAGLIRGGSKNLAASDALVVFGVTGDLVHKKVFPALYSMAKRGALDVPVIGVASSELSNEELHARATASIKEYGGVSTMRRRCIICSPDSATSAATTRIWIPFRG